MPPREIIDEQIREVISRAPREQLEAAASPRARRRMQENIHYNRDAQQQQMLDRYRDGRAQAYNRPTTWKPYFDDKSGTYKTPRAPWFDTDGDFSADFYNPAVLENQFATKNDLYPGAAEGLASLINAPGDYPMGTSQLRSIMEMVNALQTNPELFDPMYSDMLQEDFGGDIYNPDMYHSKADQIEGEDDFLHQIAMEKYGRENPLLKDWSGIENVDITNIRDLSASDLRKALKDSYTMQSPGGSHEYIYNDDPEPWNYDYVPREFDDSWRWDYGPEFDDSWKEGEDENKYYDYIGRSLGSLKEKYGLD